MGNNNTQETTSQQGFISAPSGEALKLTPEEKAYFDGLLEWQEASNKSTIILGVPYNHRAVC